MAFINSGTKNPPILRRRRVCNKSDLLKSETEKIRGTASNNHVRDEADRKPVSTTLDFATSSNTDEPSESRNNPPLGSDPAQRLASLWNDHLCAYTIQLTFTS